MTADPSRLTRGPRTDAVKDTFDEWVRTGKADGMERRHKRLADLMLERVRMAGDSRVLDVGCGDGWTARILSERLAEGAFVGIDVSGEMIGRARQRCEDLDNVLFAPASAEEIPWAENYFTHVLSIESAYYWTDLRLAAGEMYRVAAHGGSFHVLINYYRENPFSEGWDLEMGLALHRLDSDQWADAFREAGFTAVATDRIPDDSPISPGKPPAELALREGLQRVGALYVNGRKPALAESPAIAHGPGFNPFRVMR